MIAPVIVTSDPASPAIFNVPVTPALVSVAKVMPPTVLAASIVAMFSPSAAVKVTVTVSTASSICVIVAVAPPAIPTAAACAELLFNEYIGRAIKAVVQRQASFLDKNLFWIVVEKCF